jgi:hypothetical protein
MTNEVAETLSKLKSKAEAGRAIILSEATKPAMGVMFPELYQVRLRAADGRELIYSITPDGKVTASVASATIVAAYAQAGCK